MLIFLSLQVPARTIISNVSISAIRSYTAFPDTVLGNDVRINVKLKAKIGRFHVNNSFMVLLKIALVTQGCAC